MTTDTPHRGHTELPWTLDLYDGYEDGTDPVILDADGFPVATVNAYAILDRWMEKFPKMSHWADGADDGRTHRERSRAEYEANAHLIVRAVHAHYGLIEALENVQKLIAEAAMTGFNCRDGDWAERLFFSQQKTSAALKAARGEKS